jgi:hypothetical protein
MLNVFKLKTVKLIAFRRWARIVKARQLEKHLNLVNFENLQNLCQSVNKLNQSFSKN